jgi:predicted dehydrogenase
MRPIARLQSSEFDLHRLSNEERTELKDKLFTDYLPLTDLEGEQTNALLEEQRAFVAAIHGENSAGVWGRDGRRALDVAERILTSIAGHRWDGVPEGPIGPRFANREGVLRGPHWKQPHPLQRRLAG